MKNISRISIQNFGYRIRIYSDSLESKIIDWGIEIFVILFFMLMWSDTVIYKENILYLTSHYYFLETCHEKSDSILSEKYYF